MTSLRTLSRAMLRPNGEWTGRQPRAFIPTIDNDDLPFLLGDLAPAERRALHQIAETADLLAVDGKTWLLTPADPPLLDTLAAVGADAEDREYDEPPTGDSNGSFHAGFDEDMEPDDDDCGWTGADRGARRQVGVWWAGSVRPTSRAQGSCPDIPIYLESRHVVGVAALFSWIARVRPWLEWT